MGEYPEDLRELIDSYLEELRFSETVSTAGLDEAMRYSLLAGGKRIRPVLALATARAVGFDPEQLLPAAASIELIHTYSLIHDDLPAMDDDDLRRGMPTSHVKFGEDIAILAGDSLFAEAMKLFSSEQPGDPARVLAALRELVSATAVGGMVGGQYVDVTEFDAAAKGDWHKAANLNAERLREMHSLKTGRLIGASVGVALELAGVDDATKAPYRRFANELGLLFQMVDDILDVTGSAEELGKPSGSDEKHDKLTFVSAYGLSKARELASQSHREALAALQDAAPQTDDLIRITNFIHTRQT
ncbi:MAG: polyprenyl synthetase family protein [Solirubrobacterales bacterium]